MQLNQFQAVQSSNPGSGGFFFNREKQLFAMNPGQDMCFTLIRYTLFVWVIKVLTENDIVLH